MKNWMTFISLMFIPCSLMGCALGAGTAATAGYSLNAKNADDLGVNARKSIVDEAFQKMKDYVDANFEKKKQS